MGRLRSCCLVLILASVWFAGRLQGSGLADASSIALVIGILILGVVLPLPAYNRERRSRVFIACLSYVAASGAAFAIAMLLNPSIISALSFILPFAGGLLVLWAFRTRNRKRLSSFAGYYRG
jgi:hypothetical protein